MGVLHVCWGFFQLHRHQGRGRETGPHFHRWAAGTAAVNSARLSTFGECRYMPSHSQRMLSGDAVFAVLVAAHMDISPSPVLNSFLFQLLPS